MLLGQLTIGALALVPGLIWTMIEEVRLQDSRIILVFLLGVVEWAVLIWLALKVFDALH